MTYFTWIGNKFSDGSPDTGVFQNINFSTEIYFYSQEYNGFFPLILTNGIVSYGQSGEIVLLGNPTVLTPFTITDANFDVVSNEIINARLEAYLSDPQNITDINTQMPSTIITNSLTQAVSSMGLSQAYAASANYLINTNMNFAFNDIASNWQNGSNVIKTLTNIFVNHQNNLNQYSASTNSILDFKKKLIRTQAVYADSIRKVQNTANNYASGTTFNQLHTAFPNEMGKTVSTFANSHEVLGKKLSNILPSNLSSSTAIGSTIGGFLNSTFGNVVPQVANPIDKLLLDVENLNTNLENGFSNDLNITGFSSFAEHQNFVNQTVNLLQNIINKIPISSQVRKIVPTTNPALANNAIANYMKGKLGIQPSTANTLNGQANANTLNLMNGVNTSALAASAMGQVYVASDPASGGSFLNLPSYVSLFNGEIDNSIIPSNIFTSPDNSIQSSIDNNGTTQLKTNQGTSFSSSIIGNGVNIFQDTPLRPRNLPTDGTLGTYNLNLNSPF